MFEIGHIPQMRKHTAHNVDNRIRTTLALSSVLDGQGVVYHVLHTSAIFRKG